MEDKNNYSKVVGALRKKRPVLEDTEGFTDQVMQRIHDASGLKPSRERGVPYLFSWIHNSWLKGAMTAAAVILAAIFVFQQLTIANRIDTMEKQLVRTMDRINGQDASLSIVQRVKLKMASGEQWVADSVTVSRSDLEDLLNAYQEIRRENESIREQLEAAADSRKRTP